MIAASRVIPAPPERVFEFLSDLHNHWRLDAQLERLDADGDGGRVRLRRVILVLGGRRYLRGIFARTLENLGRELED